MVALWQLEPQGLQAPLLQATRAAGARRRPPPLASCPARFHRRATRRRRELRRAPKSRGAERSGEHHRAT
eukprot:13989517-Alexandrium_andersonii.AAC.1